MKNPTPLPALLALLLAATLCRAQNHPATGIVLKLDKPHHTVLISCEAIPGYMSAMEMPFAVRDPKTLATISPGATVRFTIVKRNQTLSADDLHPTPAVNFESEPMEADGLTALKNALNPSSAATVVEVGQPVPDFALTDQTGKDIHLSQFRGKVVALTFGYSRCPNPAYCFRLSNNLSLVEKRFSARAPHDLILLTIAIDPEHDQGETLRQYAAVWHADPALWHFLTGPLPDVKQVAGMFNMNFWRAEGLLTHSLHTVIIDRNGDLAANLEGNQFTPRQLGDLIQTVMNRPQ
jgi:protein SCO1/2